MTLFLMTSIFQQCDLLNSAFGKDLTVIIAPLQKQQRVTFQKAQSHINMYLAQIQGYDSHF